MSKDEEMINTIELTDDDGNTVEFENLLEFDYDGRFYIALLPIEPENMDLEDGEVVIYRIVQEGDDEVFMGCESEEELKGAFDAFIAAYYDDDEYDEECEQCEGGNCDNCPCACSDEKENK